METVIPDSGPSSGNDRSLPEMKSHESREDRQQRQPFAVAGFPLTLIANTVLALLVLLSAVICRILSCQKWRLGVPGSFANAPLFFSTVCPSLVVDWTGRR